MQECPLPYIPSRLHKKNKPIIEQFEVREFLYMRCKPEVLSNPYKYISITELSHNRSGLAKNILCNPDDVLYSIKENESFEKYVEMEVCTLEIKSLNENYKFKKNFTESKDGNNHTSILELFHEPEPCMYPHSVFRVWLNDEKVTYDNYKTTLKKTHKIRNAIKEELASMIRRKQVSQEDDPI